MQVLQMAAPPSAQLYARAEVRRSRAHLLAVESQLQLMHAQQDEAWAQAQDSILDAEHRLAECQARLGQIELDLDSACAEGQGEVPDVRGLDQRNNL